MAAAWPILILFNRCFGNARQVTNWQGVDSSYRLNSISVVFLHASLGWAILNTWPLLTARKLQW